LIGQNWTSPKFFHGRPDDFGRTPEPATTRSSRTARTVSRRPQISAHVPKSFSPNTEALIAYWHKMGVNPTPDLVTTSGSGLDPDISPADAYAEVPMVSRATGLSHECSTPDCQREPAR